MALVDAFMLKRVITPLTGAQEQFGGNFLNLIAFYLQLFLSFLFLWVKKYDSSLLPQWQVLAVTCWLRDY